MKTIDSRHPPLVGGAVVVGAVVIVAGAMVVAGAVVAAGAVVDTGGRPSHVTLRSASVPEEVKVT